MEGDSAATGAYSNDPNTPGRDGPLDKPSLPATAYISCWKAWNPKLNPTTFGHALFQIIDQGPCDLTAVGDSGRIIVCH
jgi:hypothetical protein